MNIKKSGRPPEGNYKLLVTLSDQDKDFLEKISSSWKVSRAKAIRNILRMLQARD